MSIVYFALQAIIALVIIDAIASWIVPEHKFPRRWTAQLTRPLYMPFHRLLPPERTGGLDLAPLGVIIVAQLIQRSLI